MEIFFLSEFDSSASAIVAQELLRDMVFGAMTSLIDAERACVPFEGLRVVDLVTAVSGDSSMRRFTLMDPSRSILAVGRFDGLECVAAGMPVACCVVAGEMPMLRA